MSWKSAYPWVTLVCVLADSVLKIMRLLGMFETTVWYFVGTIVVVGLVALMLVSPTLAQAAPKFIKNRLWKNIVVFWAVLTMVFYPILLAVG